jgi:hypothetical protein
MALATGVPLLGFVGINYCAITWFGWTEPIRMEWVYSPALTMTMVALGTLNGKPAAGAG